MSDTYLALIDIETLFQQATMTMLALDPADPASAYKVRIQYPQGGAPAWKITEDVCFIHAVEADDRYNRERYVENAAAPGDSTKLTQRTWYTRVMEVSWVFYGPHSFDSAETVRDWLFYQAMKDLLNAENLYLIPDIAAPRHTHELFEGQWWSRHDLAVRFNELVVREQSGPTIADVPLTVEKDSGIIYTQDIS